MEYDIIIVGAGPIGLMLANLLGLKKIKTLVIEKESKRKKDSKAIGITPPSLMILKKIGLDKKFIAKGVRVNNVIVHGTRNILGNITFNNLESDYKFILSIPQIFSEELLEKNLVKYKSVKLIKGREVKSFKINDNKVYVNSVNLKTKKKETSVSDFLCACDGSKSTIRNILNINFKGNRYKDTFLMGDFTDRSGFKNQAHLFFTKKGPVESFPLPGGKRRWIVSTDKFLDNPDKKYLEDEVLRRTGIDIATSKKLNESPFGVQHYLSKKYFYGRVLFCGDSSHVMSPIGGQGMNTGFADAEFCEYFLEKTIKENNDLNICFKKYQSYRRKAARIATNRAWMSMRIGTIKGTIFSLKRNILLFIIIKIFKNKIPPFFSMLTIPYGILDKIKNKINI